MRGITWVTIWVIGILNLLTKSRYSENGKGSTNIRTKTTNADNNISRNNNDDNPC